MIERKFVEQKIKEMQIREFIKEQLAGAGSNKIEIQRTPFGEKIIVYTSRPGLIVGKKGENIKNLTETLKTKFGMENPQIEIGEIKNPALDANSIAERMVYALEKFGSKRFKSIGYQALQNIMDAGALGAEITIAGKVPSARAKKWRFAAGYIKKSGDVAVSQVQTMHAAAKLKSGVIGIKVSIMPPDVILPDKVEVLDQPKEIIPITKETEKKKAKGKRKTSKRKAPKKKVAKETADEPNQKK